jgi:sigma-B regulation protein RsbU (phosphoserine phosphatase)
LFWAYFTPETGTLRYINAGHLPPLLIHAGGGTERLGDGGPVLGLLPAAQFRSHETQVEAGDLLIVFSDGIAEAMNQKEEEFGDERIVKIARQNLAQSPQLICHEIVQSINRFIAPLKPHDDQTLLIVRLTAVGAAKDSARLPHPETMPV